LLRQKGLLRHWTFAVGGALVTFLLAYVLVLIVFQDPTRTRVADLMGLVPPFAVAVLCCIAAHWASKAGVRWFWILFAVANVSWGLGAAVRAYYEVALHVAAPYPSVADIGLLAYLGFAFAGLSLLVLPRVRRRMPGGTLAFDIVLFAVTAAAVCWELIIAPSYESGVIARVNLANVGYSVGDTLIVVVLVSLLLTSGRSLRPRGLKWVGGCLAIGVAAHVTSAVLSWNSVPEAGIWLDPFWVLGSTFAGVGALLFIGAGGQEEEPAGIEGLHRPSGKAMEVVRMSIPYAAIPSIAAVLCVRFIIRDGGWQGASGLADRSISGARGPGRGTHDGAGYGEGASGDAQPGGRGDKPVSHREGCDRQRSPARLRAVGVQPKRHMVDRVRATGAALGRRGDVARGPAAILVGGGEV
jgi:hypothetical protein